jgi:hypothetical protein
MIRSDLFVTGLMNFDPFLENLPIVDLGQHLSSFESIEANFGRCWQADCIINPIVSLHNLSCRDYNQHVSLSSSSSSRDSSQRRAPAITDTDCRRVDWNVFIMQCPPGPASVHSRCAPRGSSSRHREGGPMVSAGAAQYPCAGHRSGRQPVAPSSTPLHQGTVVQDTPAWPGGL